MNLVDYVDDYLIARDVRGHDHIGELRRETVPRVGFIRIILSENICFRHY